MKNFHVAVINSRLKYCFVSVNMAPSNIWKTQLKQQGYAVCEGCDLAFLSLNGISSHVQINCSGEFSGFTNNVFPCEICGVKFSKFNILLMHKMKTHGIQKSSSSKLNDSGQENLSPDMNGLINSQPQSAPQLSNPAPCRLFHHTETKKSPIKPEEALVTHAYSFPNPELAENSSTLTVYSEEPIQSMNLNPQFSNLNAIRVPTAARNQTFQPVQKLIRYQVCIC